jgi:hypothetical protein
MITYCNYKMNNSVDDIKMLELNYIDNDTHNFDHLLDIMVQSEDEYVRSLARYYSVNDTRNFGRILDIMVQSKDKYFLVLYNMMEKIVADKNIEMGKLICFNEYYTQQMAEICAVNGYWELIKWIIDGITTYRECAQSYITKVVDDIILTIMQNKVLNYREIIGFLRENKKIRENVLINWNNYLNEYVLYSEANIGFAEYLISCGASDIEQALHYCNRSNQVYSFLKNKLNDPDNIC